MLPLSTDMKLVHAVLQSGVESYFRSRLMGVRRDILFPETKPIWDLFEKLSVKGRLPSLSEIHSATGIEIDQVSTDPLDVELHAEIIIRRGLTAQIHKELEEITDNDAINNDPIGVRNKLSDLPRKLVWSHGEPYSTNNDSSLKELLGTYERAAQRGSQLLGLSSPWPIINEASNGLQPGELTVLFAKRKVGKSWATIVWAVHIWRNDLKPGDKILFVSMEMEKIQILQRLACIDLKFGWNSFLNGKLSGSERSKLFEWIERRKNAPDDEPNIIIAGSDQVQNVNDLSALVAEHRPKCCVVDSFYIMGREDQKSIYEQVLGNVQKLKLDIAARYKIPVLASTQLKGTVDKDVLMADSDDAMGAKAIGDYADVTIGLFMDPALKAANQRLLRGMEARQFLPRGIKMWFDLSRMDFSQIEEVKDFGKKKDKDGESKKKKPRKPSTEEMEKEEEQEGDLKDLSI